MHQTFLLSAFVAIATASPALWPAPSANSLPSLQKSPATGGSSWGSGSWNIFSPAKALSSTAVKASVSSSSLPAAKQETSSKSPAVVGYGTSTKANPVSLAASSVASFPTLLPSTSKTLLGKTSTEGQVTRAGGSSKALAPSTSQASEQISTESLTPTKSGGSSPKAPSSKKGQAPSGTVGQTSVKGLAPSSIIGTKGQTSVKGLAPSSIIGTKGQTSVKGSAPSSIVGIPVVSTTPAPSAITAVSEQFTTTNYDTSESYEYTPIPEDTVFATASVSAATPTAVKAESTSAKQSVAEVSKASSVAKHNATSVLASSVVLLAPTVSGNVAHLPSKVGASASSHLSSSAKESTAVSVVAVPKNVTHAVPSPVATSVPVVSKGLSQFSSGIVTLKSLQASSSTSSKALPSLAPLSPVQKPQGSSLKVLTPSAVGSAKSSGSITPAAASPSGLKSSAIKSSKASIPSPVSAIVVPSKGVIHTSSVALPEKTPGTAPAIHQHANHTTLVALPKTTLGATPVLQSGFNHTTPTTSADTKWGATPVLPQSTSLNAEEAGYYKLTFVPQKSPVPSSIEASQAVSASAKSTASEANWASVVQVPTLSVKTLVPGSSAAVVSGVVSKSAPAWIQSSSESTPSAPVKSPAKSPASESNWASVVQVPTLSVKTLVPGPSAVVASGVASKSAPAWAVSSPVLVAESTPSAPVKSAVLESTLRSVVQVPTLSVKTLPAASSAAEKTGVASKSAPAWAVSSSVLPAESAPSAPLYAEPSSLPVAVVSETHLASSAPATTAIRSSSRIADLYVSSPSASIQPKTSESAAHLQGSSIVVLPTVSLPNAIQSTSSAKVSDVTASAPSAWVYPSPSLAAAAGTKKAVKPAPTAESPAASLPNNVSQPTLAASPVSAPAKEVNPSSCAPAATVTVYLPSPSPTLPAEPTSEVVSKILTPSASGLPSLVGSGDAETGGAWSNSTAEAWKFR